MTRLPLMLTALRALLSPVMVLLAWFAPSGAAFAACLVAAFVSDILDGVVARRLGIATATLRRLDSVADSLFYAGAALAAWHLHPTAITSRWWPLCALLALEACRYAYDLAKFRREASYHMWSSKAWGVALFAAFLVLLGAGRDTVLVDAAIWLGILADLEGLAISVVLRDWRTDVPTLVHALRLRRSPRP